MPIGGNIRQSIVECTYHSKTPSNSDPVKRENNTLLSENIITITMAETQGFSAIKMYNG